jgi:hypothetical protein
MAKEVAKKMIGSIPRKDFEVDYDKNIDAELKRTDKLMNRLSQEADRCIENGKVDVGWIYSYGVADGQALYRVESLKPLTLQHIPYSDGYRIAAAHLRGLTLKDIEKQFNFEKVWHDTKHKKKGA